LLLHGAIGSSKQMLPLKTELEKTFSSVHVFDFPGHGGKPFAQEPFSIPFFSQSVFKWMDENHFPSINIFGYSMGGYVALDMARHYPDRVGKIFTLGTKLEWDYFIAQDMVKMIDTEKITARAPILAEALKKMHEPNDWKEVLHRTTELFLNLGNYPALSENDFASIQHEVILGLGDNDKMVTTEETMQVYSQLPNGRFEFFSDTAHAIEQSNLPVISGIAAEFFK
ncbi:MAG TPA: alpha/beta hydrolase, partial [Bacteroidia bacterium]|nr:alpha/beta hydrolase [Bacteroidia bacterium]